MAPGRPWRLRQGLGSCCLQMIASACSWGTKKMAPIARSHLVAVRNCSIRSLFGGAKLPILPAPDQSEPDYQAPEPRRQHEVPSYR